MDNILDLLNGSLGKEVVDGITQKTDASAEETQAVVSTALPALMGALQNNATSGGGAQGILNATGYKHDGSILDNVSGFIVHADTTDGNGILTHRLGTTQGAEDPGRNRDAEGK